MARHDAFRMELDTIDWKFFVRHCHYDSILTFCRDKVFRCHLIFVESPAVISPYFDLFWKAMKQPSFDIYNQEFLRSMLNRLKIVHSSARIFQQALHSETNPQDGSGILVRLDQLTANSSLRRNTWPRTEEYMRIETRFIHGYRVISLDLYVHIELLKQVNKVIRERVEIVYYQYARFGAFHSEGQKSIFG